MSEKIVSVDFEGERGFDAIGVVRFRLANGNLCLTHSAPLECDYNTQRDYGINTAIEMGVPFFEINQSLSWSTRKARIPTDQPEY